jgi:hypothetical protein
MPSSDESRLSFDDFSVRSAFGPEDEVAWNDGLVLWALNESPSVVLLEDVELGLDRWDPLMPIWAANGFIDGYWFVSWQRKVREFDSKRFVVVF